MLGAAIFHGRQGWSQILAVQAIIAILLVFKGLFLSFWVRPFLLKREREGPASEPWPDSGQSRLSLRLTRKA